MTTPQKDSPLVKKQRLALTSICNKLLSQWAFKAIKTWDDVYLITGKPSTNQKQGALTSYGELKEYVEGLKSNFEIRVKQPIANVVQSNLIIAATSDSHSQVLESHPEQGIQPAASIAPVTESDFSNTNDYGLPVNTNHKAFLFWFQKKAVKEILDAFFGTDVSQFQSIVELKAWFSQNKHKANVKRAMLLLAATGTGKTFMAGAVMRYLVDVGYHEGLCFGPVKYLYITRATIVEQTDRVFRDIFLLTAKAGVEVMNIEQLRSRAGGIWIDRQTIIVEGEERDKWEWRQMISPVVVLWDESQALKNDGTQQNLIAQAYNEMPTFNVQLFISATPFTRVCEAKCFAVATRHRVGDMMGLGDDVILQNSNWQTYASLIAGSASDPTDYNEAAVERLVKDLDAFIVRVRGVRPQFDASNRIEMIHFESAEERAYYEQAWERYMAEKAKLEAAGIDSPGATGNSRFQILVQFLKFRMAAEYCRRKQLAKRMHEAVVKGNKAAVCALNFKHSIIGIVKILCDEYGVKRSDISLIWGGGQTGLSKKQKQKKQITEAAAQLQAAGMDVTNLLETLDLDEVEDKVLEDLPEHLRLGSQSKEERQKEIDRFQSGKSLYCLFTFRAGGVGLSLHHTDEQTKQKVRKQKNGYAVLEDIPNIPVRPRINFVAPTYSAIELVQGLGRCPRLTSLSDTEQVLLFYAGTVEQDVASVVSQKLRCLSKVVRQKEKWLDVIVHGTNPATHIDKNVVDEKGTNYDELNELDEDE